MDILSRAVKLPDQDGLWLPTPDLAAEGMPIVRYRNLQQDKEFRKELRRALWRDERGAFPVPGGPQSVFQVLGKNMPRYLGAVADIPVGVTPTTLGSTTARIFPFTLDGGILIAKICLPSPNAVATSFQLGLFDVIGVINYTSGAQGTSANLTVLDPTDFYLAGGIQRYCAITNNNASSATTAYYFSPAFVAATPTYWGTVAATAGAMPAGITPASITSTVGGFPVYIWFQSR